MDSRYRSCVWVFGLLMMLGLVSCGATDQASGGSPAEQPAATPATDAATPPAQAPTTQPPPTQVPTATPPTAAAQLSTPALRPQRTAISSLPRPAKPPVAAGTPTITSRADGWQVYRDQQAGFSVAFPPDWTVDATGTDEIGAMARFGPLGGAGIQMTVQPGDPPAVRQPERSNQVCERVVVGRLSRMRCVDTTTGRIVTTLAGKGRTFVVATAGPGIDEAIYGQIIDSFAAVG
jgi:hypothetical protein